MARHQIGEGVQLAWVQRLCSSLRMTYTSLSGKPIRSGDRVTAHPEFDPSVVAAMDAALGRRVGNAVYARAFQMCKPRADAMLERFEAMQQVTNRPFFQQCLRRVWATYQDPELVTLLKRPKEKNPRWDSNPQPCA
jgi:hypothetical protein